MNAHAVTQPLVMEQWQGTSQQVWRDDPKSTVPLLALSEQRIQAHTFPSSGFDLSFSLSLPFSYSRSAVFRSRFLAMGRGGVRQETFLSLLLSLFSFQTLFDSFFFFFLLHVWVSCSSYQTSFLLWAHRGCLPCSVMRGSEV